tara:strand:- start:8668 stop:9006 length:339 start_codon:yes stop_codon:yes gene_type:complete
MSRLFDSEIVQKEMDEMTETYTDLMMKVPYFAVMNREQREEVIDDIEKLCDKQEILYSRATLMNDEDSEKLKQNFKNAAIDLGIPEEMVGLSIFKEARKVCQTMRDNLDNLL